MSIDAIILKILIKKELYCKYGGVKFGINITDLRPNSIQSKVLLAV